MVPILESIEVRSTQRPPLLSSLHRDVPIPAPLCIRKKSMVPILESIEERSTQRSPLPPEDVCKDTLPNRVDKMKSI